MRIWCGEEKEGFNKGQFTYFIEESCLSRGSLKRVKKVLTEGGVLYFGAGEKVFKRISNKFINDLKEFLLANTQYKAVFEMSLKNTLKYQNKLRDFSSIVCRIDKDILSATYRLKVRQNSDIYVFDGNNVATNTISSQELNNMYYATDKMLLEK